MDLSHLFLLISLATRVIQLIIFVFVIRLAWKEARVKDRIWFLRYTIFFMIAVYVSSLMLMLYTTYCRFDHCYSQLNLDAFNLYSAVAGLAIAIVLLIVYSKKYIDD